MSRLFQFSKHCRVTECWRRRICHTLAFIDEHVGGTMSKVTVKIRFTIKCIFGINWCFSDIFPSNFFFFLSFLFSLITCTQPPFCLRLLNQSVVGLCFLNMRSFRPHILQHNTSKSLLCFIKLFLGSWFPTTPTAPPLAGFCHVKDRSGLLQLPSFINLPF